MITDKEIIDALEYSEQVAIPLIEKVKKQLYELNCMIYHNNTSNSDLRDQVKLIVSTLPDTELMKAEER